MRDHLVSRATRDAPGHGRTSARAGEQLVDRRATVESVGNSPMQALKRFARVVHFARVLQAVRGHRVKVR
jgi:hypothetical protein